MENWEINYMELIVIYADSTVISTEGCWKMALMTFLTLYNMSNIEET